MNRETASACILLVDDDRTSLLILRRMIETLGYECDVARNGAEAVAAALTKNYTFIFMDNWMPVMNGYEAASEILQLGERNVSPTIIGMVALYNDSTRLCCEKSGMKQVLGKPIIRETLAACLGCVSGCSNGSISTLQLKIQLANGPCIASREPSRLCSKPGKDLVRSKDGSESIYPK